MYYRIYGVMSETGFNNELGNKPSLDSALEFTKSLDSKRYPYFAVTEHRAAGNQALSITFGLTGEPPSGTIPLVVYKTNPMEDFEAAQKLFGMLKEKEEKIHG